MNATPSAKGKEGGGKQKKKKKKKAPPPPPKKKAPPPPPKKKVLSRKIKGADGTFLNGVILPATAKSSTTKGSADAGIILHTAAQSYRKSHGPSGVLHVQATSTSKNAAAAGGSFNRVIHGIADRLCHDEAAGHMTGGDGLDTSAPAKKTAPLPMLKVSPKASKAANMERKAPLHRFKEAANMVRARVRLVNAFRLLSLGDSEEPVLDDAKAKVVVERAVVSEVVELSMQRRHIRRQLEDIIGRRDPAKLPVVDRLMAQFDCDGIPFAAIFAMLKVKIEHSYPGECLVRQPKAEAAAPAAPLPAVTKKKKKKKKAPAPPPPPRKAEASEAATAVEGEAKKTTPLPTLKAEAGDAATKKKAPAPPPPPPKTAASKGALHRFKAAAKTVMFRLRIVRSFTGILGAPATAEDDIDEKVADAGAAAEVQGAQKESADAASPDAVGWSQTMQAMQQRHIETQLTDILTRLAPQKLPVVPMLMSQFDSKEIPFKAVFAMLKVKIEHTFPGEVLTDKLPTANTLPYLR